jgi:hypothetical protein
MANGGKKRWPVEFEKFFRSVGWVLKNYLAKSNEKKSAFVARFEESKDNRQRNPVLFSDKTLCSIARRRIKQAIFFLVSESDQERIRRAWKHLGCTFSLFYGGPTELENVMSDPYVCVVLTCLVSKFFQNVQAVKDLTNLQAVKDLTNLKAVKRDLNNSKMCVIIPLDVWKGFRYEEQMSILNPTEMDTYPYCCDLLVKSFRWRHHCLQQEQFEMASSEARQATR